MLIHKINCQIINNILSSALSQFFNSKSIKTLSNEKLSWLTVNLLKREEKAILKVECLISFKYY